MMLDGHCKMCYKKLQQGVWGGGRDKAREEGVGITSKSIRERQSQGGRLTWYLYHVTSGYGCPGKKHLDSPSPGEERCQIIILYALKYLSA